MIRTATVADLATLTPETEPLLRILSLVNAYDVDCSFCRFWVGEGADVLALFGNTAYWHPGADLSEGGLFLTMLPEARVVHTTATGAAYLGRMWSTEEVCGEVLCAPSMTATDEVSLPSPAAVYPLIDRVFPGVLPPFDEWYADAHHRWRHGCFHTAGVEVEGALRSVAVTLAETPTHALLGGVATEEGYRRRGYAAKTVTALTARLQAAGQAVWLVPMNAEADRLYRQWGFVPVTDWGEAIKV